MTAREAVVGGAAPRARASRWQVIGALLRDEVAAQLARPVTWVLLAALFGVMALMTTEAQIGDARNGNTPVNAPYVLGMLAIYGSVFALLPIAAIAGTAAARDLEARITPLVYTLPLDRGSYLGGRFLAALLLAALVAAMVPLGVLVAVLVSDVAPELLGPLRPAAYLGAYLTVGLPNALVVAALAFTLVTLTRRPMAGYGAAALLFVATVACAVLARKFGHWTLASLLDPLALSVGAELSSSWSPEQKRTDAVWLVASFVRNRVLWTTAAVAVLGVTWRRFRFAHAGVGGRRQAAAPAGRAAATPSATPGTAPVPAAARRFGAATRLRQTVALAREAFLVVARGWGGIALLALAVLVALTGPEMMEHIGVPLIPTTARLADYLAAPGELTTLLPWLVIAYYAGELVWRDRDAGLAELAGAAPVPAWSLVLGRTAGLALALAAAQALLLAAAAVVQWRMGYASHEPWLAARLYLGLQLADHLLFVALAVTVHVLVAHKYVGHLLVILAYAWASYAGALGVEHVLLVFSTDPGWSYTGMRGFGGSVLPWLTVELYWAGWALLLLALAVLLWIRGPESAPAARLRLARRRLTRRGLALAALPALLVVGLGAATFHNTNVRHRYRSAAELAEWRVGYEARYRRHADAARPRIAAVQLRAELEPARRTATIAGTYRLVHDGPRPLDTLHLAPHPDVTTGDVRLDRAARLVVDDTVYAHRIYALDEPLAAGDTLTLRFTVRVAERGFANGGVPMRVVANGTVLPNTLLPAIGYQPQRELADVGARRARGLPAGTPAFAPLDDATAPWRTAGADRAMVETVIGTARGERPVAPGTLRRTWTERGRQYAHYATTRPIRPDFTLVSADYARRASHWQAPDGRRVALEVLHHPAHGRSVARMLGGMRATLDHLSAVLGPYPHDELRFVEHPGTSLVLHASPINVWYQEGYAMLDPAADARDVDLTFAVAAHEVAHQWWGNQLTPARTEGAALLSESLAWYSALGVVEHAHGAAHRARLVALLREAYGTPRSEAGPPLLRATGDFLGYRKGPLALVALREYAGAAAVDRALRDLLVAYRDGAPPLATTRALYARLEAAIPDSLHPLLHDLFAANTVWSMAVDSVTATPVGADSVRLALTVRATKLVVDTVGVEQELPMADLVEVGVYGEGDAAPHDDEPGTPLHRGWHRLRSGVQRIEVVLPAAVARRATRAGVDPRRLLFDLDPGDNVAPVQGVGGG